MIPGLTTEPLPHRRRRTAPAARRPPSGALTSLSYDIGSAGGPSDCFRRAWDRLTRSSSFFLRSPYLRALERTRPACLELRHAVVSCNRRPVAAVAAQYIDLTGEELAPRGEFGHLAATICRRRVRLLLCGNVFSWGRHGLAATERPSLEPWSVVVEALERIDRAENPSRRADCIVIKDLPGEAPGAAAALGSLGFVPMPTEPDMVLELPVTWASFDDYLASLKTRYRRSVLRVARRIDGAGYTVERLPGAAVERYQDRLQALYRQVHDAARLRLARAPASYLPALARIAGDRLRCTVVRRGSELAAFVTTLRDGDTAVGYHLGFDRRLAACLPLYPRLLHATLADALALGCRRLSLGRTALDSKARLGASPVPLTVWLRLRPGLRGRLARVVAGQVSRHRCAGDVPIRHPFRRST